MENNVEINVTCNVCGKESTIGTEVCMGCGCPLKTTTLEMDEIKNDNKMRIRALLLYFVGYMFIGACILTFIVSIIAGLEAGLSGSVDPDTITELILKYAYQFQIVLDIIALIVIVFLSRKMFSFEQFKNQKISKIILITLGSSVVFLLVNIILGSLIGLLTGGESTNQQALADMLVIAPYTLVFAAVIFAPIVEEIVFRGAIFNLLKNKTSNPIIPIVVSGAIFGAVHVLAGLISGDLLEMLHFITYFVMGCGFGFIYHKTKNIYVCIGVHMINNLIAVIMLFLS